MLIEIRNWHTGKAIFSLDVEDNSIKRTVEEAVKQGVSLRYANLSGANISGANLWCAYLRDADLSGANLSGADLNSACLSDADISGSDLSDANVSYADLTGADIHSANLNSAKLSNADLSSANLSNADLSCADLGNAYLGSADLSGADLNNVNLRDADLRSTKNVPDLPMVCPKEGSFIAWKKIWDYEGDYKGDFIVKLEIPVDAKRSSATGNKCRCSKAKVLEIRNIDTDECIDVITNTNIVECAYKVDEYVYPDSFDENRWNECSNGIHFFMTEQEALDY